MLDVVIFYCDGGVVCDTLSKITAFYLMGRKGLVFSVSSAEGREPNQVEILTITKYNRPVA